MARRKTRLAKAKDNPRSAYWCRKADAALTRYVLARDGGRCVFCGEPGAQVHHLIDRCVRQTRHAPENAICLCAQHHRLGGRISAHRSGVSFSAWLMVARPIQYNWVLYHYLDRGEVDYRAAAERLGKETT